MIKFPAMPNFCSNCSVFWFSVCDLQCSARGGESLLRKQLGEQLALLGRTENQKWRRTSHLKRLTLVWLSHWFDWKSALTVVTPRTFIGWHRKGFQLFWRRKCQSGRPWIPPQFQHLIRQMAPENRSWGQERIASELLLKLGADGPCDHSHTRVVCALPRRLPQTLDSLAEGVEFELSGDFLNGQ